MTPGIHLVHKPVGPTSFSIVQKYHDKAPKAEGRRPPRICHGGTLDPFASGLLLILVEPATRLFDHLHDVPKVYEATVRWGIETDNGDPHGQVTLTGDPSALSAQQLDALLNEFNGWQDQVPPATSNKRIDGERAYARAHRGEPVVLPPAKVYLHEARWLAHDLPHTSKLRISVRGGYYVRSLARDLGRRLGCGAHLTQLHRVSIGPWIDPGPEQSVSLTGDELLPWLPSRILTDQEVGALRQERPITAGQLRAPSWELPAGFPEPQALVRGFHQDRFAFLLRKAEAELHPLSALRGGM